MSLIDMALTTSFIFRKLAVVVSKKASGPFLFNGYALFIHYTSKKDMM